MTPLPSIIKDFIKAANDHDSQAFIDTFADDALVNDFARNFQGKEQIKNWSDKEMIAPKVTFEADTITEHYGDFIITALTDGNYDKSKAAVSLFHDDATYWFPTLRETSDMPAFAEGLKWILSRLVGPIKFKIGQMVAENNKVTVQLECFATTVEGIPYNNLYHIYYEFEGGKVKLGREHNDTAHVFKTLRVSQEQ